MNHEAVDLWEALSAHLVTDQPIYISGSGNSGKSTVGCMLAGLFQGRLNKSLGVVDTDHAYRNEGAYRQYARPTLYVRDAGADKVLERLEKAADHVWLIDSWSGTVNRGDHMLPKTVESPCIVTLHERQQFSMVPGLEIVKRYDPISDNLLRCKRLQTLRGFATMVECQSVQAILSFDSQLSNPRLIFLNK